METLAAVRLTAGAARRLGEATRGRIHSAFARTINVELPALGDAGWVSLHGPGPIPAPFGIACARPPDRGALAGQPVRVEAGALVIVGALWIGLADAPRVDTTVSAPTPRPAVTWCLSRASPGGGLLPVASALLQGTALAADPLAELAAPALTRLAAATAARDPRAWVAAARPLLGLGPGLTPAGDDCLVGWVAGMWVAPPGGGDMVEAIGSGLLAAAAERTSGLSRAFLAAAIAGEVAEPVHRFLTCPDALGLSGLIALGETSGADLLAGYLLARHALAA